MSDIWSDEELRASVEVYIDMLRKESKGEKFVKKRYYEQLSEEFGRTAKSFEFRMQNISYIYSQLGRKWVSGLRPAKNVGPTNASKLQTFIAEIEGQSFNYSVSFDHKVGVLLEKKKLVPPLGVAQPTASYSQVTNYERDPAVKAWIISQADGICECCEQTAPFITESGVPFLEVHHLKRLADGGSDTVANAVAICPNCHRELHYGTRKLEITDVLFSSIQRLLRE